jgi:hypothetical protein
VSKILRHLGLPIAAPMLAPARRSGEAEGVELGEDGAEVDAASEDAEATKELLGRGPPARPQP